MKICPPFCHFCTGFKQNSPRGKQVQMFLLIFQPIPCSAGQLFKFPSVRFRPCFPHVPEPIVSVSGLCPRPLWFLHCSETTQKLRKTLTPDIQRLLVFSFLSCYVVWGLWENWPILTIAQQRILYGVGQARLITYAGEQLSHAGVVYYPWNCSNVHVQPLSYHAVFVSNLCFDRLPINTSFSRWYHWLGRLTIFVTWLLFCSICISLPVSNTTLKRKIKRAPKVSLVDIYDEELNRDTNCNLRNPLTVMQNCPFRASFSFDLRRFSLFSVRFGKLFCLIWLGCCFQQFDLCPHYPSSVARSSRTTQIEKYWPAALEPVKELSVSQMMRKVWGLIWWGVMERGSED